MDICRIYPGSYAANTYLLTDSDSGHAVVVDPSAPAADILRRVAEAGCTLDAVWLTHGHFDHILSIDALRDAVPGLTVAIHKDDAPMPEDSTKNGYSVFFREGRTWRAADVLLEDGQTLRVGRTEWTVIHTPGHSPGSICFFDETDHILLTGDTLFADNIGRCDLWGGSPIVMRQSLNRLREFSLAHPAITIYPGHGEENRLARALDNAFYW